MSQPTVRAGDVPDDVVVVDVRNDDEWRAGRVPGSVHVPMGEFIARYEAELPRDRDIVVVCKVGARSAQVTAFLHQQGWTNVRNLEGGLVGWARAGRPLEADGGAAPEVI